MEEQMLKLEFAFTDEFNQESRMIKTVTTAVLEDNTTLDFIVEEFKLFLIGSGFSQEQVSKLRFEE